MNIHEPPEDFGDLLVAIGRSKDVGAFETVFRHFAPRIKGYMARLVGNETASEELMQETMVTIWLKADQFDPTRGSASAWIFAIARNLRVDALRRRARPPLNPHEPLLHPVPEVPADMAYERKESALHARNVVANLPEPQRVLLQLMFFEGKSLHNISKQTGLPLNTLKTRLRRLLSKLRAALEQDK